MFCPKCSQEQFSQTTRFCSRCGFLLTGIIAVVENDGIIPNASNEENKKLTTLRKKGLKQGLFMLLLTILLSPILMILGKELHIRPALFILSMFILFTLGIVRMLYAKMFETDEPESSGALNNSGFQNSQNILQESKNIAALTGNSTPISDFIPPIQGSWRNTDDLAFSTAGDVTTKQLRK